MPDKSVRLNDTVCASAHPEEHIQHLKALDTSGLEKSAALVSSPQEARIASHDRHQRGGGDDVDTFNRLKGGSLSKLIDGGHFIVKHYDGYIERGHEKLAREFQWINNIGAELGDTWPTLVPRVSFFQLDGKKRVSILTMEKVRRESLTKLIRSGRVGGDVPRKWLNLAVDHLFDHVYPIASTERAAFPPDQHLERLAIAERFLRLHGRIARLFDANLVVNGIPVPNLDQILRYLRSDAVAADLANFPDVTFHGNFHADNVLVDASEAPSQGGITLIDPRGELCGPAYYDISKILCTTRAYYDEVHYDAFSLADHGRGSYSLAMSPGPGSFRAHDVYGDFRSDLLGKILGGRYESMMGNPDRLIRSSLICQVVHSISFSFYHVSKDNCSIDRVIAFLLIAAMNVREFVEADERGDLYGLMSKQVVL